MASAEQHILFEHWANQQSLAAVARADDAAPEALSALAHSAAISQMWASRVEGVPATMEPWPMLSAEQIGSELISLRNRWLKLSSNNAPDKTVRYTNGKGEACTNRFEDVMLEVLLHGAHHRGQAALALRMKGFEPPRTTDYIPALRSNAF